ncbi:hypothetical protein [Streptomyces griseoloalbus]|uniref:Uncharacterized protein n=1 Tax=Streptomyces griseoloalbus TaxID=67303 RepID=A0A7W8BMG5_9ACTN|nr:hypothetical protein [Streptomyces albaduncus]MBB5125066.1 hypothetical protein [Streptomyces albaduncus]GGV81785.1 hypothetical protein GCM10010294_55930 [Streptomyces griseoloalbus]GGW30347.1 hypothetical protein GCM10010340_05160 [Streptomyces albaduncus]
MAHLVVEGRADARTVVVRLSWWEALVARRRAVRVPVSEVRATGVEPDWWRAMRGTPVTGRCRPGRFCVGEREHPFGRDFVAVRAGVPAVVVDLRHPVPFVRLAVSVPDAGEAARTLRRHSGLGGEPGSAGAG